MLFFEQQVTQFYFQLRTFGLKTIDDSLFSEEPRDFLATWKGFEVYSQQIVRRP